MYDPQQQQQKQNGDIHYFNFRKSVKNLLHKSCLMYGDLDNTILENESVIVKYTIVDHWIPNKN